MSYFGKVMLILTGILSVGFALSTVKSDRMSGEINHNSSVPSMNVIKTTQHIETTAPATVGCVRSLGIFLYMSNFFTSNTILEFLAYFRLNVGLKKEFAILLAMLY